MSIRFIKQESICENTGGGCWVLENKYLDLSNNSDIYVAVNDECVTASKYSVFDPDADAYEKMSSGEGNLYNAEACWRESCENIPDIYLEIMIETASAWTDFCVSRGWEKYVPGKTPWEQWMQWDILDTESLDNLFA